MTPFRRSIGVFIAGSALGLAAFAAPANATLAGGGNYAASVATSSLGNGIQQSANVVQLRGYIASTSNVVTQLHGKVTLSMYRAQTSGLVARRVLTVNGPTGTIYATSVTIPSTIPRGSSSTYYVVATFSPTAGHIEKTSYGRYRFFRLS